jgi:predicted RNase H-like HicB family nuclease
VELNIEIFKSKEGEYIATCPKLDIYSYGKTVDKAITRLKEIVNFYRESAEELGITIEELCIPQSITKKSPKDSRRYLIN